MKFAWALILMNTIVLVMDGDALQNIDNRPKSTHVTTEKPHEEIFIIGDDIKIDENEESSPLPILPYNPTFSDHLIEYTGKAIYTGITCIPHALRLTLGLSCLFSKNRDHTYLLMQLCGFTWALYYLGIGMGDDYHIHNHKDSPPLMQSIYFNSALYSGFSYLTNVPHFIHFGALHSLYDIGKCAYKALTKPKKPKS
jgi:hypothetical protein